MRRRRLEFSDAFALALQKHRTAKELSRQALAEKAGLHQTYVGMIERGFSNSEFGRSQRDCRGAGSALF
jgi:transcriptional regulator with XRE-family HTH domain